MLEMLYRTCLRLSQLLHLSSQWRLHTCDIFTPAFLLFGRCGRDCTAACGGQGRCSTPFTCPPLAPYRPVQLLVSAQPSHEILIVWWQLCFVVAQ